MKESEMTVAEWVTPPIPPQGMPKCPCCGASRGPRSWEIEACLTCYDAYNGNRTDSTVYTTIGVQGGFKTVKYQREHTKCPLTLPLKPSERGSQGTIPTRKGGK